MGTSDKITHRAVYCQHSWGTEPAVSQIWFPIKCEEQWPALQDKGLSPALNLPPAPLLSSSLRCTLFSSSTPGTARHVLTSARAHLIGLLCPEVSLSSPQTFTSSSKRHLPVEAYSPSKVAIYFHTAKSLTPLMTTQVCLGLIATIMDILLNK